MSNVIDNFKHKIKKIIDLSEEAFSSMKKNEINDIDKNHQFTLNELERAKQEELKGIKEEYDKRLLILSSNKDKINGEEYSGYISAAESIYNKKVSEVKSSYENKVNTENEKVSDMKKKCEKEHKSKRISWIRKKIEILKEREVNLLVEELNKLREINNKEKEKIEIMRKQEEKKIREEYSNGEIEELAEIYIPEEERKKISEKVLSGYLSPKLIDDYEILIGDEVIKRKVEEKMHNEEYKKEIELRKLNEQKYSEVSEAIKQIMALKLDEIVLELEQPEVFIKKNNNEEVDVEAR